MPAVIAKIRLAQGQLGFVDNLSGIYLNWSKPSAEVFAGMNCSNLRNAVKSRKIVLTAGSLGRPKTFKEILSKVDAPIPPILYNTEELKPKTAPIKKVVKEEVKKPEPEVVKQSEPEIVSEPEEIKEEVVQQEVAEEPVAEEIKEETSNEEPVEDKPKKKSKKKKS